ncbi:methyltransferase domain-containing protein [Ramlibacter tataouinensis]|uniref:class I SAM-dependent methyltransferase n=1 Tax=Ramlibacter tataouinensis TaxID=94132 RepID=UPI0022F3E341|nr:methyltransferase domain-containing protein [Ramlibacter tataouinensis]WBY00468.1 methyltransferase domain-containing protein [Ramlibacter tataouinensis]
MSAELPPTIDPAAAARWVRAAPARSPWLHDEVARRMAQRLEWIRLAPQRWAHWEPVRGGLAAQPLLEQRYPQAVCLAVEPDEQRLAAARQALGQSWWQRWGGPRRELAGSVADASVQMLWANMALHFEPRPAGLLARWLRALQTDGFLMFSCFGPDTLRELHALYRELGWPPPGPQFTDMHDWGDMLVEAGFAEPVMDMERLTLTWETPQRLLAELRELGANLHPGRFAALRGKAWRTRLEQAIERRLRNAEGRLALTFEIVYGHALRPEPRVRVQAQTAFSLDDMRGLLRGGAQKLNP